MSTKPIEYADASPRVRAVYDVLSLWSKRCQQGQRNGASSRQQSHADSVITLEVIR